jgi:hypothetical protein
VAFSFDKAGLGALPGPYHDNAVQSFLPSRPSQWVRLWVGMTIRWIIQLFQIDHWRREWDSTRGTVYRRARDLIRPVCAMLGWYVLEQIAASPPSLAWYQTNGRSVMAGLNLERLRKSNHKLAAS